MHFSNSMKNVYFMIESNFWQICNICIYLWTQPYMLLGLDMIFDPFILQKQAFESGYFAENIEKIT